MTPGTLAAGAALVVALALALSALVVAFRSVRGIARLHREAENELRASEHDRGRLEARVEQLREYNAELDAELERYRCSPLEGRTVIVNTPKPDDQAIRGVVTRELEGGGVILAAAVYLEREEVRGGGTTVREVPAGDVIVPRVAWSQLLNPTQEA